MSIREELLHREDEAWRAFEPSVRTGEGLAFGWSTSEVAGHMAFWMDRAARMLEAVADGTMQVGAFAVDIDVENDARRPGWAAFGPDDAVAAMTAARERLRAAWSALPDPDGTSAAWFAEDSFEHYEEHMGGS